METEFKPNPFFEKEVVSVPELFDGLRDIAIAIGEGARENVHAESGEYAASVEVEEYGKGRPQGFRVIIRTPYASLLEFGGRFMKAQYPLRNAVEALGLKFKKKRG